MKRIALASILLLAACSSGSSTAPDQMITAPDLPDIDLRNERPALDPVTAQELQTGFNNVLTTLQAAGIRP